MPVQTKTQHFSLTFHCAELFDLTGACTVQVRNKPKMNDTNIKENLADDIDITGLGIIEDG